MKLFAKVALISIFVMAVVIVPAYASNSHNMGFAATGEFDHFPPTILDSGGPDAYGYYYYDSEDGAFNGPTYNWIDISGTGIDMEITGDDQNVGPFPIGFTFNFYGIDFISFRACSNGWVSFSSSSTSLSNQPIPTADAPNDLLAIFWDDLHPQSTGHAYYYSNGVDTLIIAYHNFQHYPTGSDYTFEAIITADGNILYQYQSMTGTLDSHTIGIENSTGTVGLEYVYNTARDESGTAILFSLTPPDHGEKDILVIVADESPAFLSEIVGYDDIGTATYYDGRAGTPTLEMLEQYDAVVVWSNYTYYDPVAMGNVLADYLDEGGAVTMLMFNFGTSWQMQGRLMTEYCPFTAGDRALTNKSLGNYDAGHPLMKNVSTLTDYFSAIITLQNSPILVASYADGTPLAAYNPLNNLVALNIFVGSYRQISGDFLNLCHNAIMFTTDGPGEILLIEADYGADLPKAELYAYPDVNSVHIYNARNGTPSLELLQQYDAVSVWSNYPFDDPQLMGNRLADYVDMGGGVVIGQFSFLNQTNYGLEGRLVNSYSPFGLGAMAGSIQSMGWHNPNSPLMQGVNEVTDRYMSDVSMENDGVAVASWEDSTPFVAYNPDHDVVAINGYYGDDRDFTGDMMVIVHNALNMVRGITDIEDESASVPRQFSISQNYPNPFNPTTAIAFNLPTKADVSLEVYNVLGQRVANLNPGEMAAGKHILTFDASNLSSGVYFYRLNAGDYTNTRKMTVLK